MRKIIIIITGLVITGGVAGLVIFTDREPASKPFLCNGQSCNVILIIPETLSARHMGIYGYERDTTPFIDEFFSEESLVFENTWSVSSWTAPSFAAFFTAQFPSKVFVEGRTDRLSDTIPTFIDILDQNGISKFAAHTWSLLPRPNIDLNLITRFKIEERFQGEDPLLFLTAVEWIKEQIQKDDRQPFFLFLQPFAPHRPYDAPEPYRYFFDAPSEYPGPTLNGGHEELNKIRTALREGENIEAKLQLFRLRYDQEIRYLDSQFGSFIAQLPEEVLSNTVFIFTSDHGEAFGQHNNIDHGLNLYEEEIHVPFLVRVPGVRPRRIQELITLLDAGPTILDIFGLESPDTFQGISLLPVTRGEKLRLMERIVRAEEVPPDHSYLKTREDWERFIPRVRMEPLPYPRQTAMRKGNWKLLQRGDGSLELYNLERDYYEQDNLIPYWYNLSQEERAEILPLFEALGESSPL